jgi:hypothetical protein
MFLPAALAIGPDGLSDAEVAAFLVSLQDSVRSNDPKKVAALVKIPLRVGYSTKNSERAARVVTISGPSEFVRRYPEIFTADVRAAVLTQSPATLFRNWQGVMIGNGELWYAGVCQDARCSTRQIRVISLNIVK